MTRVIYVVGNQRIANYHLAVALSNRTGISMKVEYEPVVEERKPNLERIAKIQKYFAERRLQRA